MADPHEDGAIWTIGHGTAGVSELLGLLARYRIRILVDVRSCPYSRHAPQANREAMAQAAARQGIEYRFLGRELGGRPSDPSLLGADGRPDYQKMEASPLYQRGIDEVRRLATLGRVCLMCAEEDPARCHRSLLVSETLARQGYRVNHIRHDGSSESHDATRHRHTGRQLSLFETT